ncbi:unnamed protein product, partial [Rotaria sordida]
LIQTSKSRVRLTQIWDRLIQTSKSRVDSHMEQVDSNIKIKS